MAAATKSSVVRRLGWSHPCTEAGSRVSGNAHSISQNLAILDFTTLVRGLLDVSLGLARARHRSSPCSALVMVADPWREETVSASRSSRVAHDGKIANARMVFARTHSFHSAISQQGQDGSQFLECGLPVCCRLHLFPPGLFCQAAETPNGPGMTSQEPARR